MGEPKYDHFFTIVLIGEQHVGKTCICFRFIDNSFSMLHTPTRTNDRYHRTLPIGDAMVVLQVWDTPSEPRVRTGLNAIPPYSRADGIIAVYDISNQESFRKVSAWLQDAHRYTKEDVDFVLVGNKADLPRVVPHDVALEYSQGLGMTFVEFSAKDDVLDDVFIDLATQIFARKVPRQTKSARNTGNAEEVAEQKIEEPVYNPSPVSSANKKKNCAIN